MKPLKVIVIESSIELAQRLESSYTTIFKRAGYEPQYVHNTTETGARKAIEVNWPHVLICDMSLGQESDGLLVVRNVRKEFPDLFCILASKAEYKPGTVFAKQAHFDLFFDKSELIGHNEKYVQFCAERFKHLFRLNTCLEIDEKNSAYRVDYKVAELRELNSLLSQVTFTSHDSDTQITPDTVRISKLTGGFSGSKVYKFNTFNSRSKLESVPAVLKVSEREWAVIELNNYHKFVKWGLPYTWRVDVLGSGTTKKFGAVAYSFIPGEPGVDFNSLTHYLEEGEYEIVSSVINKIFSPTMRRWYGDALIEPAPNIIQHYRERYFRGAESKNTCQKEFTEICASVYGAVAKGTKLSVDGIDIEEPVARLFGTPMLTDTYLSCICHGDLNSNNVIVSNAKDVIFIDFQETGRGHVFEDFVTLESSVRLFGKASDPTNWHDYLKQEIAILPETAVALASPVALISSIRQLAADNFRDEPMAHYYYACAMFHFRLLRAQLSDVQKKKCVAAVIAALAHLQSALRRRAAS